MKQKYLTILLSVLMSMVGAKAFAHDIEVENADGVIIYYNFINEGMELAVTYLGDSYDEYNSRYRYVDKVAIPESVTYKGNTYNVTHIGDYAFYNCDRLSSVTIPNSVTSIGDDAFYGCWNLTEVTIPNSVTSIGNDAFYGCYVLASVTIPNSVTSIGDGAFSMCYELTEFTIPNNLTKIADRVFWGSGLTKVIIPSSVTSIGSQAFYVCNNMKELTIGDNVTSIGYAAFGYCNLLTELIIPNSVTSIGDYAFTGCYDLKRLTIGNSVVSIGSQAFGGSQITSVTSLNPTPPDITWTTFTMETRQYAILHVPAGCKIAYELAEYWTDFHIQDDATDGIESTIADKQVKTAIYTLDGKRLSATNTANLPKGIYVVNGKKVVVK